MSMLRVLQLTAIAMAFAFVASCSSGAEDGKVEDSYPDNTLPRSETGGSYKK